MNKKLIKYLAMILFFAKPLPASAGFDLRNASIFRIMQIDGEETGSSSLKKSSATPQVLPPLKELPFPSLTALALCASISASSCTTAEEYLETVKEVLPPGLYDEIAFLLNPSQYAWLTDYAKQGFLKGMLFDAITQQHIDYGNACVSEAKDTNSFLELKRIYLNSLGIVIFPSALIDLTQLNTLNLKYNNLVTLPPEIKELKQLVTLDLSHNQIETIPPEIGGLFKLESVNLAHNKIHDLPKEIKRLFSLTHLDLSYNEIEAVPKEIGQLRMIWKLNLSHNQIETVPAEILSLTQLESLKLAHNKIQDLPAEIVQLRKLWHLDLSYNKIRDFPDVIMQLSELDTLDLSYNQIATVPLLEIVQLPELAEVNLSNNKIKDFPSRIEHGSHIWNIGQKTNILRRELSLIQLLNIERKRSVMWRIAMQPLVTGTQVHRSTCQRLGLPPHPQQDPTQSLKRPWPDQS